MPKILTMVSCVFFIKIIKLYHAVKNKTIGTDNYDKISNSYVLILILNDR